MEEEIWKDIENCSPYQISNLGRIKNTKTGIFLNPTLDASGYVLVSLCINKKTKKCRIHRLIAQAFIPNPENKPTVNHIDRNRSNNNLSNLEWATMSEQNFHSAKNKKQNPFKRKITQLTISEEIINNYSSVQEASIMLFNNGITGYNSIDELKISIISSKICAVANNIRTCAYGYKWKYNDDLINIIDGEIWKEIPFNILGINNYWVSNYGRIKNNKNILKNPRISANYLRITINKKCYLVHRLVAFTFLENPLNKEHVNHIDGNKLNNELNNLEWCTCSENNLHKIKLGLSNCTKKVIQYDNNMNKIKEFDSIVECAKEMNVSASCISFSCSGRTFKNKTGYQFRYATEE